MSSTNKEIYPKEIKIYNEILKVYHPRISVLPKEVLPYYDLSAEENNFNIEFMIEQAAAHVGGLFQSSLPGEDFTDNSEFKTATTRRDVKKYKGVPYEHFHKATIKDIYKKKDLIRAVVYNVPNHRLDFFAFRLSEIGFDRVKSEHLCINYNEKKDIYGRFETFRYYNFEEICKIK